MKLTDTSGARRERIRQLLGEIKPAQPPQEQAFAQLARCFERLADVAQAGRRPPNGGGERQ